MANLNFPINPAAQTPANTFGPNTTPASTSNGVNYVYDGSKWVADFSGSTYETPDLQAVTEEGNTTSLGANFGGANIQLKSGGDITASGKVTSASTEDSDSGNTLVTKDYVDSASGGGGVWTQGSGGVIPTTVTDNVYVGNSAAAPNITLNADGSAKFVGDIETKGAVQFSKGVQIPAFEIEHTQAAWLEQTLTFNEVDNNGTKYPRLSLTGNQATSTAAFDGSINAASDVKIGGLPSAPNITLNANGNAEFGGRGRFGNTSTGYAGPAVSGYANTSTTNSGGIQIKNFGTGANFSSFDAVGNNTAYIMAEGSATFSGPVKVNLGQVSNPGKFTDCAFVIDNTTTIGHYSQIGFGYTGQNTEWASAYIGYVSTLDNPRGMGDLVFGTRATADDAQPTERLRISSDGSASFTGNVSTTARFSADRANPGDGCYRGNLNGATTSIIYADGRVTLGGTPNAPTVDIKADGSAEFTRTVFAGSNTNTESGLFAATGNSSAATPAITARNYAAGGDLFTGYDSTGAINVTIKADGSATYAGNITAGNVTFNLEADDDTKYTATTDANGEVTTVYNGAVLNVKESIETAVAARAAIRETFQELLVAVQSATDFGELKAAMLVALEDYAA